jgi:hypothetical protein
MRLPTYLALVVAVAACGTVDLQTDLSVPDAGSDAAPEGDPTSGLFAEGHVLDVRIELPEPDWDSLRHQTRSVIDIFGGDCLSEPFARPFSYFPARVTVDGVTLPSVAVRKKGFLGSLSESRPSLKIKFDELVPGQRLSGADDMTLNNAQQDPALVRQCVGYALFGAAGVPAPRCNFAHVYVNDRDLGLYVHVEAIDKDFLRRHFSDDSGTLYEGTLSDFRPGWLGTFDKKTREDSPDRSDLDALAAALAVPDEDLVAALETHIDLEAFLTFWAAEVLVRHWDGYAGNTNNFYLYRNPTSGRFHFLPWGIDGILEPPGEGQGASSVMATGLLARRLYLLPETRARYVTRLSELLGFAFHEELLLAALARMEALLLPIGGAKLSVAIDDVRRFVRTRRQSLVGELVPTPPEWTTPLRDAPCFHPIGQVEGSFDTTWGTLGSSDPFKAGKGSVTGTVSGMPIEGPLFGSTAGLDPDAKDGPRAAVHVVAHPGGDLVTVVALSIDPALLQPGASIEVDWTRSMGYLVEYNVKTEQFRLLGLFGQATIELDEVGTTAGARVTGRFKAELVTSPF